MDAFVGKHIKCLKVGDVIVEFVSVDVMDRIPRSDWPVVPFPNKNVLHAIASLFSVIDTPITLGGDVSVSTRS